MEHLKIALDKSRGDSGPAVGLMPDATDQVDGSILLTDEVLMPAGSPGKMTDRKLRSKRIVAPLLQSPEADLFRALRTQIRRRMERNGSRTIAICGARDNEGKSFIAANLACSFALEVGQKVILADLDLRRPGLHNLFDLKPVKGVDQVLSGEATVGECLMPTGFDNLSLLPVSRPTMTSSELLSSPRAASLARELRDFHPDGVVIYDLPPILVGDDCLAFSRHVDACLFVVEEGRTRKTEVRRALSLLDPELIIGTVLNKTSMMSVKYHDYY